MKNDFSLKKKVSYKVLPIVTMKLDNVHKVYQSFIGFFEHSCKDLCAHLIIFI